MKALTFCLRLLEPMLVSQAESGEENSAVGLSFIPGSALRGAFVGRYLRAHPSTDLAVDREARRLFFDGKVCFLNAYPWREHNRLLPKPLSWFTEKDRVEDENAPICDWAVDPDQSLEQPKSPAGEFCHLTNGSAILYTPPRQINVHISLEDPNRRDERNKVYRYDALAEGEVFAGAVVVEDDADLKTLMALLTPEEIRIGGAHTAGYGRAKIEQVALKSDWDEYTPGGDPGNGQVIVTLLSDAILRGKEGQVNGDLSAAIASALNLPLLKPQRVYQRLRLVAGFNRKWSLPLAQTWALQAGSVFVYPVGAIDPVALHAISARGIGERRAEGFGRLAVDWHTQPALQGSKSKDHSLSVPALSAESAKLAQQMAGRRLRLLLDRRLAEAVNAASLSKNLPQNAQLSRVRLAAQQALVKGDLTLIAEHLRNLRGARQQFEDARLLGWIEERISKRDVERQLWKSNPLPEVAGVKAELTEAMKIEYTARLIDGVMRKAIKQNQQKQNIKQNQQKQKEAV